MSNLETEPPHIVRDFYIGNTRVKIADNYCRNKTKEEVDAILHRIMVKSLEHFNAIK